jgi:hypothetical protein
MRYKVRTSFIFGRLLGVRIASVRRLGCRCSRGMPVSRSKESVEVGSNDTTKLLTQ